jgi:hypothetical protein
MVQIAASTCTPWRSVWSPGGPYGIESDLAAATGVAVRP